jgi:signal transduction histidine kinase
LAARLPSVTLGPGLDQTLWVHADAQRLEQAVINLLENTPQHSHVYLDAEVTDSSVLLHVCDDGPGVPEEIRQRLFEPFASRSPGGTGLGLAIVARIMAAHSGSAALTQRAPWSTCFSLTLPLHHA